MKIELEFADEDVDRLLSHAAYSWIDLRNSTGDWRTDNLEVRFGQYEDPEDELNGFVVITREAVAKGLAAMDKEAPYQFGQWLRGDDDIVTCDAAYQCIIFGKVIYG